MRTLLVMAGGTGGHVVSRVWRWPTCCAESRLAGGLDGRAGWHGSEAGSRRVATKWPGFASPRCVARACCASCCCLSTYSRRLLAGAARNSPGEPDVVLGMGGYVSFPGGLMAALLGYPLIIHEQNSIAGLANRVLARLRQAGCLWFSGCACRGGRLGRQSAAPGDEQAAGAAQRLAGRQSPLHLLVLGGSQGAGALNEIVPRGLALIDAAARPLVVHQAGEKHLAQLRRTTRSPACRHTVRLSSKTWRVPTNGLTW
jgi:UDP-N-acetylglucosamine--N-acetylmuramyl-(pentapeptide) pyrophosphoryl-undecaprenol N-acetylglucosamine transferase